jgi:Uma2 family endonuclease
MSTPTAPQPRKKRAKKRAPEPRWPYEGPMTWQDVVDHPALGDLPFRIEQDAWGRLIMSPTTTWHSRLQLLIGRMLEEQLGGEALVECSISTPQGTRVADVVWASDAFVKEHGYPLAFPVAPEVCVEVRSPSNTDAEMEEKITLYLAKGAREVWLCDLEGAVAFFSHEGPIERSRLAPDFPSRLPT